LAAIIFILSLTFRDNILVSSLRLKQSTYHKHICAVE